MLIFYGIFIILLHFTIFTAELNEMRHLRKNKQINDVYIGISTYLTFSFIFTVHIFFKAFN